ncbi:MAG: LuxR C-terminal-related transcriptional regulator [Acidobacteriota bacterium]
MEVITISEPLTERQLEIVKLFGEGKTSKEIGELLSISYRTVDAHKANIYLKLGISSATQLIHFAIAIGLVELPVIQTNENKVG